MAPFPQLSLLALEERSQKFLAVTSSAIFLMLESVFLKKDTSGCFKGLTGLLRADLPTCCPFRPVEMYCIGSDTWRVFQNVVYRLFVPSDLLSLKEDSWASYCA